MSMKTSVTTWAWKSKNRLRRAVTHAGRRAACRSRIIASLTSYPPRIGGVHVAIQSLLAQRVLPDMIVLWLCEQDFPNKERDLPQSLLDMRAHDVVIRWVPENLKPHKKYFWALQEYHDDIVILFDDDLVYPNTCIADLMVMHERFPQAIAATRTHLMMFNEDGSLKPYDQWMYEAPAHHPQLVGKPSLRLFATTGFGTLFPPNIMPQATFDEETIRRCALNADDIWLKVMEVAGRIPVVSATTNQLIDLMPVGEAMEQCRFTYVPDTQDVALCHDNAESGGNDVILADTLADPKVRQLLDGDFAKLVWDDELERAIGE